MNYLRPSSLFLGFLLNNLLCAVIDSNHQVDGTELTLNFNLHRSSQLSFHTHSIAQYHNVSSAIGCGVRCAGNQHCVAFYYLKTDMKLHAKNQYEQYDAMITPRPDGYGYGGNLKLNCLLLEVRPASSHISAGTGVVGIVDRILTFSSGAEGDGDIVPQLQYATYLYTTRTKHGIVAVYDCDDEYFFDFTTFGWLYDPIEKKWPSLTPTETTCSTICSANPVSATTLQKRIDETSSDVVLDVFCKDGEAVGSQILRCIDGAWDLGANPSLEEEAYSCVSSSCYRYDTEKYRAHYKGQLNTMKTGEACIRWDSLPNKTSSDAKFNGRIVAAYDNNVLGDAKNYCRDFLAATLYCYRMDTYGSMHGGECDAPLCEWSP